MSLGLLPNTIRRPAMVLLSTLVALAVAGTTAATASPTSAAGHQALLAQADQALAAEQWHEADSLLNQVLQVEPREAMAYLGLSRSHQGRGNLEEALQQARKAEALDSTEPQILRQVAHLLIRLGAPTEALKILKRWRLVDPKEPEPYLLAALVLRQVERLDQAIEILASARQAGIQNPEVESQSALLQLTLGQIAAARELAEKGLNRHPDDAGLTFALAMAMAASPEHRGEAVRHLRRTLELGSGNQAKVHLELGSLLAELEDDGCSEEALEHLKKACDLAPNSAQAFFRLGNVHRACGDATAAQAALKRFQQLNRSSEDQDHRGRSIGSALNRAQKLAAGGQLKAAARALSDLLQEAPQDDRIWTLQAKVLYSQGKTDEAVAAVRKAQELAPGQVESHYLEGLFLSAGERLEEAQKALKQAAALDRNSLQVHSLLAAVSAKLKDSPTALSHFRRAIALDPEDPALRLAFAQLLTDLGQDEESRRQMELYRALSRH